MKREPAVSLFLFISSLAGQTSLEELIYVPEPGIVMSRLHYFKQINIPGSSKVLLSTGLSKNTAIFLDVTNLHAQIITVLCVLAPNTDSESWRRPSFSQQKKKKKVKTGFCGHQLPASSAKERINKAATKHTAGDSEFSLEVSVPTFTCCLCRRIRGVKGLFNKRHDISTSFFRPPSSHLVYDVFTPPSAVI